MGKVKETFKRGKRIVGVLTRRKVVRPAKKTFKEEAKKGAKEAMDFVEDTTKKGVRKGVGALKKKGKEVVTNVGKSVVKRFTKSSKKTKTTPKVTRRRSK